MLTVFDRAERAQQQAVIARLDSRRDKCGGKRWKHEVRQLNDAAVSKMARLRALRLATDDSAVMKPH